MASKFWRGVIKRHFGGILKEIIAEKTKKNPELLAEIEKVVDSFKDFKDDITELRNMLQTKEYDVAKALAIIDEFEEEFGSAFNVIKEAL